MGEPNGNTRQRRTSRLKQRRLYRRFVLGKPATFLQNDGVRFFHVRQRALQPHARRSFAVFAGNKQLLSEKIVGDVEKGNGDFDGRKAIERLGVFHRQRFPHSLFLRPPPAADCLNIEFSQKIERVPNDSTCFLTAVSMPLIIEEISITVMTPMITPKMVKNERSLFPRNVFSAIFKFS
jgi:hypothetical protein